MALDHDDKRSTPTPRGWTGGSKDFEVTSQACGRKTRFSTVDSTWNYPGIESDESDGDD